MKNLFLEKQAGNSSSRQGQEQEQTAAEIGVEWGQTTVGSLRKVTTRRDVRVYRRGPYVPP